MAAGTYGASAGVAVAGVVTLSARVTPNATGLTAVERRAITIRSVSAVGDGKLGLLVTATFGGDVERYLGQGHLRHAMLALVLQPAHPAGAAYGVLDNGGGFTPRFVPVLDAETPPVLVLDVFRREREVGIAPARAVSVIRAQKRVIFYVPVPKPSSNVRIKLEVFVKRPAPTKSSTRAPFVPTATPASQVSLTVPSSTLTCTQMESARRRLSNLLSTDRVPELLRESAAQAGVNAAVSAYEQIAAAISQIPGLAHLTEGRLIGYIAEANARIAGLRVEITDITHLIHRLQGLIQPCASVQVVQTDTGLSQRMARRPSLATSPVPLVGVPVIHVDDRIRYQRFSGIGAAMTDSSAWLIHDELSPAGSRALMHDLFGSGGIHLGFLRVPIGASDFTVGPTPYTYDDTPAGQADPALSLFSIAHDQAYILPTLKQALAINPRLEILANPWTAPAWMKSNDALDDARPGGTLLSSAYGPLASYFVKFIQAYARAGVRVGAITPENEPGVGALYPGMNLPEPGEADFISQDLLPALRAAGLRTKIYGGDVSWNQEPYTRALAASRVARDLSGIASHCYSGSPTAMSELHRTAPGLDQIVDECSPEIRPVKAPEFLISSLRNWATVVSVFNVALDPNGGPVQAHNGCPGCRGLVEIDEQTRTATPRPQYYQLGQVSAFVQPGARRIDSPHFVTYGVDARDFESVSPGLDDVAFLNPDGSKVLIVNNNSSAPVQFAVAYRGSSFVYTIPAGAMTTFVWR